MLTTKKKIMKNFAKRKTQKNKKSMHVNNKFECTRILQKQELTKTRIRNLKWKKGKKQFNEFFNVPL
jgi:hypothetical protein